MNRCNIPTCLRARIPNGAMCDAHTRAAQTAAFGEPEWVRRSREHRLPYRVEGGAHA
jgi:hypothetical protein